MPGKKKEPTAMQRALEEIVLGKVDNPRVGNTHRELINSFKSVRGGWKHHPCAVGAAIDRLIERGILGCTVERGEIIIARYVETFEPEAKKGVKTTHIHGVKE